MLEILQAPNHVAAFRASGSVTAEEYERIRAEVEARLQQHRRIAVLVELAEPVHLTPPALLADLRYALAKLPDWSRFARMAVVTEKGWLRAAMKAVTPWLPGGEARVFSADAGAAALEWVAALQPDAPPPSGLRLIATTRPDTYGFVWDGRVTRTDVEHVLGVLKAELEAHVSVRIFGRLENLAGIELGALLRSSLLRLKMLGIRKIERYALVGGPAWIASYVATARRLTGVDVRHFTREREDEAWAWLEASPVSSPEHAAGGQAETIAAANAR